MGPPLIGPICRSATVSAMPVRFGVREGFCARHWFHNRGPRRNASTCLESEDNATHATIYERNSHERYDNTRQQTEHNEGFTLMQTPRYRQAFGGRSSLSVRTSDFRATRRLPRGARRALSWRPTPLQQKAKSRPEAALDIVEIPVAT